MIPDLNRVFELGIEENLVLDGAFLGMWEQLSDWQFRVLRELGLKPSDKVLDVGCGPMRLGAELVPYLDDGNYYGIDAFEPYIRLAGKLLPMAAPGKTAHLLADHGFTFSRFGARFSFAIAQSVITHLSVAETETCIANLVEVMEPGGQFVFTYILSRRTSGRLYGGRYPMRTGRFESSSLFDDLARRHGLTFRILDSDHPTGQSVGVMTFG